MGDAVALMAGGTPEAQAMAGIASMKERLPAPPPEEDELLLAAAGFEDIHLFYAVFTFMGWIVHA